jgi:hypothetical protein
MAAAAKGGFEVRASLALGHGGAWKPLWKGKAHDPTPVVVVDVCPSRHVRWGEKQKAHGTGPSSGLRGGFVREGGSCQVGPSKEVKSNLGPDSTKVLLGDAIPTCREGVSQWRQNPRVLSFVFFLLFSSDPVGGESVWSCLGCSGEVKGDGEW